MLTFKRKRLYYLFLVIAVIILGLLSRAIGGIPKWLGDILWGLMVFCIMGFIYRDKSTLNNALLAVVFSKVVELAKLYHAPWIDAFRYTAMGGLLLGYVFSWQNILCYLIGIGVGYVGEYWWKNNVKEILRS